MKKGIDVSQHNGTIDWTKASKKVDFAILRAGYGAQTSQIDTQFENNYKGCKDNGVPVGAYWYCYALTTEGAQKEALVCAEIIAGKSFEMPIFFDIEESSVLKKGKTMVSQIARTFLTTLEQAGVTAGIYSMVSALNSYFDADLLSDYDVWCAHVGVIKPNYTKTWAIWQYSWKGKISGITGDVDLDYCNKVYSGLHTATSIDSASVGDATDVAAALFSIDYTKFTPYIATITRNTKTADLSNLKELGVIGVLIEVGSFYNSAHIEEENPNPKLSEQALAASEADLSVGLYFNVRAKTVEEAKKELNFLQSYVQKIGPPLGVWLKLDFNNSKSKNNDIIDCYYDRLIRLGAVDKIGFYVTKKQLELFDWEDRCDKWYLWLIDHVSDTSELDALLTPEFFMSGYDSAVLLGDSDMTGVEDAVTEE